MKRFKPITAVLCSIVLVSAAYAETKQQKVIEKDAAELWQQIRSAKSYDMIAGVKGTGRLKGVDPSYMTDTAFVSVNNRWHRLSKKGKQKVADNIFRRWQIISKKSGRYASLKFQQRPKYDLLAQCSDDDGCEIVE